jgi:drug/metabolite transporter (DMT)-like permease
MDGHERSRRLRGIVLAILGFSLFAMVDGISKILADTQSVGQIVWARYALAIPVIFATTHHTGWRTLYRTGAPWWQVARGITPLGISAGMVLGVHYLPLAVATVILFAGPFLIVALSMPVLGEPVHRSSWVGVGLGFLAVLIVARPGLGSFSFYALFPLAAAFFSALYQLFSRRLGAAGERPSTTLTWTLTLGGLIATPFALATWQPLDLRGWALMIALGVTFGISQSLMIRAYALAPAGLLAPFSYAQVISAVVVGIAIFGDVPDWPTVAGVVLIIASGAYVARTRARG